MANYYQFFRTNYVKLKEGVDVEEVSNFINERGPETFLDTEGRIAFGSMDGEVSSTHYNFDDDSETDLSEYLAKQMEEGQTLIVKEIGWEKLRYLIGVCVALDHNGDIIDTINLDEIYERLDGEVTRCEY